MHSETIIERAKSGDKNALNEIVNDWYSRIYNFAYKYFSDHALASEVSQKTFIAVYENLQNLKENERFKPWLYRIAGNYCREEHRKKQRKWTFSLFKSEDTEEYHPQIEKQKSLEKYTNPEEQLQAEELADLLQKALNNLKEEQRMIVIMKEYEGLKFSEIAEVLGISENTAKSRLYYGLKHLKEILEKWNITKETMYDEL